MAESPYTEKTFKAVQKKLLIERVNRFKRSLELKGFPPQVLGMEFSGIINAFVSLYGQNSLVDFAQNIETAERRRLGFCLACTDEPNYVGFEQYPMCTYCVQSAEANENEIEL